VSARRGLTALAISLLAAISIAVPAVAFAAAPTVGAPVEVQIWPQDGQTIVISSVELPASTKLPVIVRIPVVPGAKVEWAGEIVGTDASSDIARDYKLVDGVGGQYAEFYLTTSHRGQLDTVASTMTVSGTTLSSEVNWVQSIASPSTTFSVRLPATASEVSIKPAPEGEPADNGQGELLYSLPSKTLAAGEKALVTLSYNTVPAPASDPASKSANTIAIVLGVALVVAIVVLVVAMRRRAS